MYEEITIDNSIFYIEQHHVDTFKQIASKLDNYSPLLKEGGISLLDGWIIAFNIWLLLLPDDEIIIKTDETSIYYTANLLIHDAIKDDTHFRHLKDRSNAPQELFYLASLLLATGLNEWILFVMKKYRLYDVMKRSQSRKYFNALNDTEKEIQIFLEDQALFVKAAVQELREESFSQMIKKYYDKAYFIYIDHYKQSLI
ncbi:hypothetical protein [Ureibacillus sinduriensis]|uniref:Uncharacterized protein n=1 Tax=Ureibacillus sinduriensis BLB-1 = JCM 15800 TaxID=1384057 RepID=A0A0A3HTL9_9BACL|nr:hypothetical protein [Ureibacillus sinduriensis]KGR74570.1 hypothetical protein CD33_15860 [Ureibacillus sinduriensis BLB-1 = JCM 15800]